MYPSAPSAVESVHLAVHCDLSSHSAILRQKGAILAPSQENARTSCWLRPLPPPRCHFFGFSCLSQAARHMEPRRVSGRALAALAATAAAAALVAALALALLLALRAAGDWAEHATLAHGAWALLGGALGSYQLVRRPPAREQRRAPIGGAEANGQLLARAAAELGNLGRAAGDALARAWAALPQVDWALPTLSVLGEDGAENNEENEEEDEASDGDEDGAGSTPLVLADVLSTAGQRPPTDTVAVNSDRPIPFENDFFKGSLLFLVNDQHAGKWTHLFGDKKRLLWVQVQGQFKRTPPPDSVVYLAWELPVRSIDSILGFWARKLVQVLVAIVQQFNPNAHISLGEASGDTAAKDGIEVPHAAFPLYQKVDELVISSAGVGGTTNDPHPSKLPALGQETFGESDAHAKYRMSLPVGGEPGDLYSTSKVYTFQFHSMFCDLSQWRLVNLPGLPDVPLQRICDSHPIRLAAYAIPKSPRHIDRLKEYLFCFSVRHHAFEMHVPTREARFVPQVAPIRIPSPPISRANSPGSASASSSGSSEADASTTGVLSPAFATYARPELRPQRTLSAGDETPLSPTIRQFSAASHALSNLQFELSMWIERVDAVAGRRIVGYLFTVDEPAASPASTSSKRVRHSVLRSASTVKNVLLSLLDRDEDESDSDDEYPLPGIARGSFRGLTTEAREYLYDRIDDETARVAHALREITSPSSTTSPLTKNRYTLNMIRATLYHCLTSPNILPPVPSARDIGVQIPSQIRSEIICELGGYRVLASQCMRQEWIALSRRHVHFFRSFSIRACKSVPLHHVLAVRAVDDIDLLRQIDDNQSPTSTAKKRWYCVEIHLVLEVVTLFVETSGERAGFVRALHQRLDEITSEPQRQRMFCQPALPLDDQTLSVCLNQRTLWRRRQFSSRGSNPSTRESATELVKTSLKAALELFAIKDRQQWTPEAVQKLLDTVEKLNDADFSQSSALTTHNQRLAFALHLYHTLFFHAVVVFSSFPRSHPQWKKLQVVPSYLVGDPRFPEHQVRFTLRDIERELLRSPMPPSSVLLDGPSSLLKIRQPLLGSSLGSTRFPPPSITSPTSRRVVAQSNSRIPEHLALDRPDMRTCFLLQMNCDPATIVARVYERQTAPNKVTSPRRDTLDKQFNDCCARFLASELRIDAATRSILVPRVCDWYFQSLDEQRLARSSSDPSTSAARLPMSGSRAFYCLQRVMGFMDDTQLRRVQHLLMGAGDECAVDFGDFWTKLSAAKMISNAAAAVLPRAISSSTLSAKGDGDLGEVGGRAQAISLANSNPVLRFVRSFF